MNWPPFGSPARARTVSSASEAHDSVTAAAAAAPATPHRSVSSAAALASQRAPARADACVQTAEVRVLASGDFASGDGAPLLVAAACALGAGAGAYAAAPASPQPCALSLDSALDVLRRATSALGGVAALGARALGCVGTVLGALLWLLGLPFRPLFWLLRALEGLCGRADAFVAHHLCAGRCALGGRAWLAALLIGGALLYRRHRRRLARARVLRKAAGAGAHGAAGGKGRVGKAGGCGGGRGVGGKKGGAKGAGRSSAKARLSGPSIPLNDAARRMSKMWSKKDLLADLRPTSEQPPPIVLQAGQTGFCAWARPEGVSSYAEQPAGTWSVPDAASFAVRSAGYLESRLKQPSAPPLLQIVGFDIFETKRKCFDIAAQACLRLPPIPQDAAQPAAAEAGAGGGGSANSSAGANANGADGAADPPPAQRRSSEEGGGDGGGVGECLPAMLVVNYQLFTYSPSAGSLFSAEEEGECDGEGGSLVLYFAVPPHLGLRSDDGGPPTAAARLLRRWLLTADTDEGMRNRLKLIVRLDNMEEVQLNPFVRHNVRKYEGKPFMARPAFEISRGVDCHTGTRYLEVDIDTHRYSYIVKKTMTAMSSNFPQYRFSLAFLIEGREPCELPETLAGCSTCCKFDWTMLKPFPPRQPRHRGAAGGGARERASEAAAGGGCSDEDEEDDDDEEEEEEVEVHPVEGGDGGGPSGGAAARGGTAEGAGAGAADAAAAAGGGGAPEVCEEAEAYQRMATAVFEKVLPQVRELEEQGAYSAASELLAAALVESKRIADQGRAALAARHSAGLGGDGGGGGARVPAALALMQPPPLMPPSASGSVARLKQVRTATRQYRGRLFVLTRQVHGMKWRARMAELDGGLLRLHKLTKEGRLSHAKPLLLRDLDAAEVTMVAKSRMVAPTPHVFQLVTPHRTLLFCGQDETVAFAWMHAMRSVATPPPLSAKGLKVKPRSRFVLPVRVEGSDETTFTWEWQVPFKDLGFEGYFEAEGEDAQYPTLVAKWTRHSAEDGKVVGSYTVRRPGVLMLCWDNTYSVFTAKELTYAISKERLMCN